MAAMRGFGVRLSFEFIAMAALPLALAGCDEGGGDGIRGESFPDIRVDPERIVLPAVAVGLETFQQLTIRNAGGSRLQIAGILLEEDLNNLELRVEHDPLPVVLEEGESMIARIIYKPGDEGQDHDTLLIESNDADQPTFRVPIDTNEAAVDLLVSPELLNFGGVDSGSAPTQAITVDNLGAVPVEITQVYLEEGTSADFAITEGQDDLPFLRQGDRAVYEITYTPTMINADEGALIIEALTGESQAGNREQLMLRVPMQGNEPSPEIDVTPAAIAFGAIDLGGASEISDVIIENQGSAPLLVESIDFAPAMPGTNEQFTLHDIPDVPLTLEEGESYRVGVSYHPAVEGNHSTAIVIRSNDLDEQIVSVPLNGRVAAPCISVEPAQVNFGGVAFGIESVHIPIQIVNCGDLDLELQNIRLEGPEGFGMAARGDDFDLASHTLVPRGLVAVETWYFNEDLPEGEPATATVIIENNTPNDGVIEVPVRVIGGGVPTCLERALPSRVDFGLVSRGTNRTREVDISNGGSGECELRNISIVPTIPLPPPFDAVKFHVTGEPDLTLPPNTIGVNLIEVTYHPDVFNLIGDQASLLIDVYDPYEDVVEQHSVSLIGRSGESNIEVIPERLDFGDVTAGECASREERVTVYNTGIVDLCITDIYLEGPNCNEFFVVDRPVADADGCINVTRQTPADIVLQYEPANLGEDACELVLESTADDTPELRVPLNGTGVADSRTVDEFVQTSGQTVDILFVVDNSGSMSEEQDALAQNFGDFISGADQFENDFQIGVVTTDMEDGSQAGKLQGDPRIIRRGPNVEAEFSANINVGPNGSGTEPGLDAAHAALSNPLIFDTGVACNDPADCQAPDTCIEGFCGGHNRGLVREGAALEVIFVSDEEDQSGSPLNFYVDFLKSIKGFRNESLMHAHAVVGARNGQAQACNSANGNADAAPRYVDVARRTNGTVNSICDDNYGASLREIGEQAFGLPVQFFLSRPADPPTIAVTVNGRAVNDGWGYDAESNSIIFDENSVPEPGDRIRVTYDAECFERRQ